MARYTGGWIKLHRKVLKNELFDDAPMLAIWTLLLMMAYRKDGTTRLSGQRTFVKRGQVATSARDIARKLKLGKGVVERRLRVLESESMISQQTSHHGTIISIVKYNEYQEKNATTSHGTGTKRVTDRSPTGHRQGNSGEEEELLREKTGAEDNHNAGGRARNDPEVVGGFEDALIVSRRILAKALGAFGTDVAEHDARRQVGELGTAVIHVRYPRGFAAFWRDYQGRRETTAAGMVDGAFHNQFAAVLTDPDFDAGAVLAKLGPLNDDAFENTH